VEIMALDARNILVGASPLYLSKKDSTDNTYAAVLPEGANLTAGTSILNDAKTDLRNSTLATAYRNVGFTNNGLQITYNPTFDSVTVDQLLDTAKLFKSAMEVMIATEMSEGTLENVLAVFGQASDGTSTLDADNTLTSYDATAKKQELGLSAGALGVQPTERQLIAVGQAPTALGTFDGSSTANTKSERVYYARRVLSVQQSQFSLARNTPTTFPVTFRLLPDANYAGAEYGKIIDRVLS
jgi:hypothetical protein